MLWITRVNPGKDNAEGMNQMVCQLPTGDRLEEFWAMGLVGPEPCASAELFPDIIITIIMFQIEYSMRVYIAQC